MWMYTCGQQTHLHIITGSVRFILLTACYFASYKYPSPVSPIIRLCFASLLNLAGNMFSATRKLAFPLSPKVFGNLPTGLLLIPVPMCAWNQPESIGFPYLTSWRKPVMWYWLIPSTQSRKKVTKLTERMPNGFATYSCVTWSSPVLSHRQTFASSVILCDTGRS